MKNAKNNTAKGLIMSESENKETGKLGFGLMRLQRKVFSTDIQDKENGKAAVLYKS